MSGKGSATWEAPLRLVHSHTLWKSPAHAANNGPRLEGCPLADACATMRSKVGQKIAPQPGP